jgi:hypothetical protein
MNWQDIRDEKEKYAAYLASREWSVLKRAVHERAGGNCERCRKNRINHVHHLTYIRKYRENMADLQGICKPCHDFTHGFTDFDPAALTPPTFQGQRVSSIYLAGTCEPKELEYDHGAVEHNWRSELTKAYFIGHKETRPAAPQVVELTSGKQITYSGPHLEYDHNCISQDHGGNYREKHEILNAAISGIKKSDLVFAWIDREDCHGTIAEIGYAVAAGKSLIIAGPKKFDEFWFVYSLATATVFDVASPRAALEALVK